MLDKAIVRKVAELMCYQHCRAAICKDSEKCCSSYPAPGSSSFECHFKAAVALLSAESASSDDRDSAGRAGAGAEARQAAHREPRISQAASPTALEE